MHTLCTFWDSIIPKPLTLIELTERVQLSWLVNSATKYPSLKQNLRTVDSAHSAVKFNKPPSYKYGLGFKGLVGLG